MAYNDRYDEWPGHLVDLDLDLSHDLTDRAAIFARLMQLEAEGLVPTGQIFLDESVSTDLDSGPAQQNIDPTANLDASKDVLHSFQASSACTGLGPRVDTVRPVEAEQMASDVKEDVALQTLADAGTVHRNLTTPVLYEHAVRAGEGKLLEGGSFAVRTGARTGRSPNDKFVVRTPETSEQVWWGVHNQPMEQDTFDHLRERVLEYLQGRELYVQECTVSRDPSRRRSVRVVSERAYHSLFARTMFIPNDESEADLRADEAADLTILHAPDLELGGDSDGISSDAVIALHLGEGIILIAGTSYAGEMKKSVFTAMNYYLPLAGALSLHSAANLDPATGKTAFFFGLSGTGKTTLSTDPSRLLIGDDEHGWSEDGIFNIEGGCYAKVIRLSQEAEPVIFDMTRDFGTIMENVVFNDDSRAADLDDDAVTENTRGSYPLSMLNNAYQEQVAPHPSHVILLTADASGVMPPMARLTVPQALYHFLSGYTSKLAGTETGIDEPEATFSPCFGAPFMALNPVVYAEMLEERLQHTEARVWLINTGWVGGAPGTGSRIAIQDTRAMVHAILEDHLDDVEYRKDAVFGYEVPASCPGVDAGMLTPREQWADAVEYDKRYSDLAASFQANFEQFRPLVSADVAAAGP